MTGISGESGFLFRVEMKVDRVAVIQSAGIEDPLRPCFAFASGRGIEPGDDGVWILFPGSGVCCCGQFCKIRLWPGTCQISAVFSAGDSPPAGHPGFIPYKPVVDDSPVAPDDDGDIVGKLLQIQRLEITVMIGDFLPHHSGIGEMTGPCRCGSELSENLQMIPAIGLDLRIAEVPLPFFRFKIEPADAVGTCVVETDPVDPSRFDSLHGMFIRKNVNSEGRIRSILFPESRSDNPGRDEFGGRRDRTSLFPDSQFQTELSQFPSREESIGDRPGSILPVEADGCEVPAFSVQIHDSSLQNASLIVSRHGITDERWFLCKLDSGMVQFRFGQGKCDFAVGGRKVVRITRLSDPEGIDRHGACAVDPEDCRTCVCRNSELKFFSLPLPIGSQGKTGEFFSFAADLHQKTSRSPAGECERLELCGVCDIERFTADSDFPIFMRTQNQGCFA